MLRSKKALRENALKAACERKDYAAIALHCCDSDDSDEERGLSGGWMEQPETENTGRPRVIPLRETLGLNLHPLSPVFDKRRYGEVGQQPGEVALEQGFTGSKDIKSPNIDKLAHGGLILNRHYSSWMCTPTRGSIMTGRYPISLGIQDNVFKAKTKECLDENHLLPEIVRSNGYRTHMVGKWHLGYARWDCLPCRRGFDTYLGYTEGYISYEDHTCGAYNDLLACEEDEDVEGVQYNTLDDDYDGIYSNDIYQARINNIIKNHDEDKPLFLYMAMQSVHYPFFAPKRFYDGCQSDGEALDWSKSVDPRCTMQAMVYAADEMVGNIQQAFEEAGMWDNTIVIFHSDNGGPDEDGFSSNTPLRGWKTYLWEGGVRTAGFVYSKALQTHKGISNSYVHVSDWYKTIIAWSGGWENWQAAGMEMPEDLDSIDQSHYLLHGTGQGPRTELLVHIDPVGRRAAYILGQWKLLTGDNDVSTDCEKNTTYPLDLRGVDLTIVQLFNIHKDQSETTDVSAEYPEVVDMLLRRIIWYLPRQKPLKCQIATSPFAFPTSTVPYYIPWDPMNLPDFDQDVVMGAPPKHLRTDKKWWSELDMTHSEVHHGKH